MRDSFVFYRSFADAIAGLPSEEYKKVMQAIIGYALDGTEPTTGGIEYTVFCLVKPQIDANNKRCWRRNRACWNDTFCEV